MHREAVALIALATALALAFVTVLAVLSRLARSALLRFRLRVACELHVLLRDVVRRTANLDVRAVRLVDARQRIVALAVITPPHALVLTVPHGSLICQPLVLRRTDAVHGLRRQRKVTVAPG